MKVPLASMKASDPRRNRKGQPPRVARTKSKDKEGPETPLGAFSFFSSFILSQVDATVCILGMRLERVKQLGG